jgi:hypothetical protein
MQLCSGIDSFLVCWSCSGCRQSHISTLTRLSLRTQGICSQTGWTPYWTSRPGCVVALSHSSAICAGFGLSAEVSKPVQRMWRLLLCFYSFLRGAMISATAARLKKRGGARDTHASPASPLQAVRLLGMSLDRHKIEFKSSLGNYKLYNE